MYEHSTNFWESEGCAGTSGLGKHPKAALGYNVYLERLCSYGSSSGECLIGAFRMHDHDDVQRLLAD
jgi:hypothetical protein